MELNYTSQGRRPTAAQIVSAWRKAGQPARLTVEYGETFAEFERLQSGRWDDSGNGCHGVDRAAVVRALEAAEKPVAPRNWLG